MPVRKKSGNVLYAPHIYIYIYITDNKRKKRLECRGMHPDDAY